MEAGTTPPPEEAGLGYTGAPVAGAVLATVFFPFISLIAALLLQGSEQDARKKSQLRNWAWASAGWMVLWLVIVIAAAASIGSGSSGVSRSGPCQGGPETGATGQNIPGTNKYVFPCVFGGTETTRLP
jgi:hypothetical protein